MGSLMQDLKRQASFFLREKIKTARLVLTDVTPIQLLTEEVTNGDSTAPPDVHSLRLISRAAFEVDDYERVVQILHHKLSKFEAWNWRGCYKALVLLEHLLTHGPRRVAEEFRCVEDTVQEMISFSYVDHKGFDWGLSVRNKAERVVNLMRDFAYLSEERERARKLIPGIKGFGSFNRTPAEVYYHKRSNSLFHGRSQGEEEEEEGGNNKKKEKWSVESNLLLEENHPFWNKEHHSRISLLSSV